MIEFKRYGDVMIFDCPAFKIEVAGNGAERIELNREAINNQSDYLECIYDALKILDMMIEHKALHTHELKDDFDIHDSRKSLRELMKKEGL